MRNVKKNIFDYFKFRANIEISVRTKSKCQLYSLFTQNCYMFVRVVNYLKFELIKLFVETNLNFDAISLYQF